MTVYEKGILPNPTISEKEKFRKMDDDLFRFLDEREDKLDKVLNMGIGFFDNLDAVAVEFTSSGTPDAENSISHTLGKVPTGFIVYDIDKGAVVYKGTTAWNSTTIYLKVNTATTVVKALVF